MGQSLAIPRVIPNDWKRLDLVINKIKMRLGRDASLTFAGLTLTGLTASTLIGADADKALESITVGTGLDYTRPNLTLSHLGIEALTDPGADKILFWDDTASACKWLGMGNSVAITDVTLDTIQDIRTSASPTFAGLTLSGLTQGSVIFVGGSSVLSQDNSNLFWDVTNNRLGIGINTGFFPDTGMTVSGEMDVIHTAIVSDDHAFEIDLDAAGYGDVKAIDIDYITGAITVGKDEGVILINIDEILAEGGDVFGLEVLATEGAAGSTTGIYGMKTGVLIGPIHQDSGTFENPTIATNDTPSTNVPYMIDGLIANTTPIFSSMPNDDDYILIGDIAVFEEIEFIITTGSSGAGIKPKFEYSRAGSNLFTEFFPVDGTNGFRNTGVVAWDATDLVNHGLNTDTAPDTYCIKITRQRTNLTTTPVLGFTKVAATTEYIWDKDGNVNIKTLTISTIAAEGSDVDKFLVDSSGLIKYRTGAQVLSDIGGSGSGHLHDGDTLQLDAVNSNVGAFAFNTTGEVTFNQTVNATFAGNLTGNVTGNVSGSSGSCTGNSATATALATARNIGGVAFDGTAAITPTTIVVADTTDTSCFVGLWESATGSLLPKTDAAITYNAGTAALTTTTFIGALTGQADTVATITGLAPDTATTQATQAAITTCVNLTTVGAIGTGAWEATDVAVAHGGTGASTAGNARTNLGLVIGTNVLAQQTIGIADDNLMEVDDTDAADNDYAKFTANGLEGRSAAEVAGDIPVLQGDATAGRVVRVSDIWIDDGTNADTLKCTLRNIWNGDVIAVTDNIAKGATTGNYTLTASGKGLRINATGLSGNPLMVFVNLSYNDTGTTLMASAIIEAGPSMEVSGRDIADGVQDDWTVLVEGGDVVLQLLYITDA